MVQEDGKKINIVTRCGANIVVYAAKNDQDQDQWVRKNTTPQQNFDVRKEKETFKQERQ
jgi:hypothetical protein